MTFSRAGATKALVPPRHCPTPDSPCRWLSRATKTLGKEQSAYGGV